MYHVLTINYAGRFLLGAAPDFEAAKAMIPGEIHFIEEDNNHPDCYDLINDRGELYSIEIQEREMSPCL